MRSPGTAFAEAPVSVLAHRHSLITFNYEDLAHDHHSPLHRYLHH